MGRLLSVVPFHNLKTKADRCFGANAPEVFWFLALLAVVYPVYSAHLGLDGIRLYRLAVLGLTGLGYLYMTCKICFLDDNSWGQLLGLGACLVCIGIGCLCSGTFSLLSTFLAVFSAKNISFRKICRGYCCFFAAAFLLNFLLLALGVIQDVSYAREEIIGQGIIRHGLGFGHPNSMGFWSMLLVFSALLTFDGRRKLPVYGILIGFVAITFLFSNSKAYLLAAGFALVFCLCAERFPQLFDRLPCPAVLTAAAILLITAGFVTAAIFFDPEIRILKAVSNFTSMRIELANWGFRDVGFSLFGQKTPYASPVDSLMGYAPIWLGVIPSLLYLGLTLWSGCRAAAHRRWTVVIICVAAVLYCTMEYGLINPVHAALFAATARLDNSY